ncbi:MAG: 2-amino-4-hydroxy-6-hydroxymethyldihydropteridine diphosphokinase [Bacteroidetes bacterium]|jgi:2-amino-4-hydroxy-6-hydroxymethyldihydropteridine diphosphokinase|nr:2-amino-4-hydroxy-6-hydroxymethyldihydropteridine diphosphokinase [Bacteroidota bacterium]
MPVAYIGIGSNLGDREAQVQQATQGLLAIGALTRLSSLYETKPWGNTQQGAFVNAVAELETELSPEALLEAMMQLEQQMGRVRGEKWGPRTIDLDLLLMENLQCHTAQLQLPHPGIAERLFVLVPWMEIAPRVQLPDGRQVAELAEHLMQKTPAQDWPEMIAYQLHF